MLIRCACGWEKNVKDELQGKKAECPKCHANFVLQPAKELAARTTITRVPAEPQRATAKPAQGELVRRDDYEPSPPAVPQPAPPQIIQPIIMQAPAPAPAPVVNQVVQVNVNQSRSNSIGTLSLLCGAFALFVCWIPLVGLLGMPLACLGLLLGGIGFLLAMMRRSGYSSPVLGIMVSGLAVMICIAVNTAATAVVTGAASMAADAQRRVEERRAAEASQPPTVAEPSLPTTTPAVAADPVATAALAGTAMPSAAVESSSTPEPAPLASPTRAVLADPETEAGKALQFALTIRRRNMATGDRRLRELIEKFPGTEAATEAAKLLANQ